MTAEDRKRALADNWRAVDEVNDRGMMGDGVIDIPRIRGRVEAAGYAGYSEWSPFPRRTGGSAQGGGVLDICIERLRRWFECKLENAPLVFRKAVGKGLDNAYTFPATSFKGLHP